MARGLPCSPVPPKTPLLLLFYFFFFFFYYYTILHYSIQSYYTVFYSGRGAERLLVREGAGRDKAAQVDETTLPTAPPRLREATSR
eukprot:15382215-Heterocapsa_arctica.AAC.1